MESVINSGAGQRHMTTINGVSLESAHGTQQNKSIQNVDITQGHNTITYDANLESTFDAQQKPNTDSSTNHNVPDADGQNTTNDKLSKSQRRKLRKINTRARHQAEHHDGDGALHSQLNENRLPSHTVSMETPRTLILNTQTERFTSRPLINARFGTSNAHNPSNQVSHDANVNRMQFWDASFVGKNPKAARTKFTQRPFPPGRSVNVRLGNNSSQNPASMVGKADSSQFSSSISSSNSTNAAQNPSAKRNRSMNESDTGTFPKRKDLKATPVNNDIMNTQTDPSLTMAVVEFKDDVVQPLDQVKFANIFGVLNQLLFEHLDTGANYMPVFESTRLQQGVLRTECSTAQSKDWLVQMAGKLSDALKSKLVVCEFDKIPQPPVFLVFFPYSRQSNERLLAMLNACNPATPDLNWDIIRRKDSAKGTHLVVRVSQSVREIIIRNDNSLHFGMGQALFKELPPKNRTTNQVAPTHKTVSFNINDDESLDEDETALLNAANQLDENDPLDENALLDGDLERTMIHLEQKNSQDAMASTPNASSGDQTPMDFQDSTDPTQSILKPSILGGVMEHKGNSNTNAPTVVSEPARDAHTLMDSKGTESDELTTPPK